MKAWRNLIRQYVDARNQAELENDISHLKGMVPQDDFYRLFKKRLDSAREQRARRNIKMRECTTRLKFDSWRRSDREVMVDAVYTKKRIYQQAGRLLEEESAERERILLVRTGERWSIGRVIPDLSEKYSGVIGKRRSPHVHGGAEPYYSLYADGQGKNISRPYMNPYILGGQHIRNRVYNRQKAVQYADRWWNENNPEYIAFQVDCTNYVSQCLYAGGAPMHYTGVRNTGWWYRTPAGKAEWSYSWSVSNSLRLYLMNSRSHLIAVSVGSPYELAIGDIIIYDWEGDNQFNHCTIVTAFDMNGAPLVNAHTVNSRHRYWDYRDSYAWTERTQYRFFHISDEFD